MSEATEEEPLPTTPKPTQQRIVEAMDRLWARRTDFEALEARVTALEQAQQGHHDTT